ncbi:hypothetical protein N7532_001631 [Penicillium argentinense]|uniref:WD repeat protein n=1 Tax=Penicillium argentinense TaxID=1131581 RepID=A0A9W9G336_9EURO|nr:uncharacterized protein N7532_001631 [Penicillium argentinense]KAJ5111096.1 hypothetical protein N7532_001631 [Penicillium argentinense]
MSSPGSNQAGPERDDSIIWHPAQEWLEEDDENDPDYTMPPRNMEAEDDWDGDDAEDEPLSISISDGESHHSELYWALHEAAMSNASEMPEENPHINIGNIQIELTQDDLDDDREAGIGGPHGIPAAQIFELLAANGLQHILQSNGWATHLAVNDEDDEDEDEDDEDDDDLDAAFIRRMRPRRAVGGKQFPKPKVPSDEGTELMGQGHFGTNQHYVDRLKKRKRAFATDLMWRELGVEPYGLRRRTDQSLSQRMIPGSVADKIIHYDSRSYSGQFSDDGNFFSAVRMYDTSNPFEWKYYKTVDYPFGQWTITDATLSPDNRFLVYSSIRSQAYLATTDPEDDSDPTVLDFSLPPGQRRRRSWGSSHFGIWSLRFSGDGREVVAGTSEDSVIVYDIETKQPVLNLRDRHQHHVNAVCYGDTSSPHLLYSGSDDTTLRVWDRRSMADGREAGAFMGHTEGITYVDSKGDGRYVLSNGKDQTMKLWDLRKMMTTVDFDRIDAIRYTTGFDYRFEPYPDDCYEPHEHDCSVVTFRGHRVLKTLIRCHFSPPGSTNSRYVYTGSEDGKVYVYNMDATLAGTIDVGSATLNSRPRELDVFSTAYEMSGEMLWRTCVRDASWHPNAPVLAATSWNGWGLSTGTCTVHSWNDGANDDEGDPPIGKSYDDKLRYVPEFNHYREHAPVPRSRRRPLRSRPVRRQSIDEDDEDEMW